MTGRQLVAVAAMAAALAGCGEDERVVNTSPPDTTITGPYLAIGCLEQAGLADVEQRSAVLWRGFHADLGYIVTVQQLSSVARARALARDAVDVYRARRGAYVVVGPANELGGSVLTEAEAAGAVAIVRDIADCMGNRPKP